MANIYMINVIFSTKNCQALYMQIDIATALRALYKDKGNPIESPQCDKKSMIKQHPLPTTMAEFWQ